jgi:ribonucleoside-diphosphate reductase alpha chain
MLVTKRDGTAQPLDLDKIHAVIEWAVNGDIRNGLKPIKGVSVSQIEMQAQPHFHNRIKTSDIHETIIRAAANLISLDTPNYDHVAARLRWFDVRKKAFQSNDPPHLIDIIKRNSKLGLYDHEIVGFYSTEEWHIINGFINHQRDDLFRFAGAEQMYQKYLVQNRKTKKIYETFQIPYIMVAAVLFHNYPKETRLDYVKRYYDQTSQHYVSLPTPIMAGLRTKTKQFSSCTLIDSGDSLNSINSAATAIVNYASQKAGIGLNIGRIRAAGQPVRNGDAVTTGVLPFAKYFAAALKSCSQGAVRGASATFNYPLWHLEFETLIELKNNKGTSETRLPVVDYCVHINKTMYERLLSKGDITFFTPDEVPDLYEAFYGPADTFKELYEKYEGDPRKTKKSLPAVEVFTKLISERFGTGRIYIMHSDHVNTHSSIYEKIYMTNLCVEITQHTKPMGNDNSLIALCTLSALNWGKIQNEAEMEEAANMAVRALDELLDYQDYPNDAAERHTRLYRPLGVGIIGLAHDMVKNGWSWMDDSSLDAIEEKMEVMAYHLTKASITLATEKGACPAITKYHDGIFPMDTAIGGVSPTCDWESLRSLAKANGIRNATLSAFMPSETSSQLANEVNGAQPPRSLISTKGNKDSTTSQVVPEFAKYNHAYELEWDIPVQDYFKVMAKFQKYVDQSISANSSYDPNKGEITVKMLLEDLLFAYKMGIKTLYYNNTNTDTDATVEDDCADGACKI